MLSIRYQKIPRKARSFLKKVLFFGIFYKCVANNDLSMNIYPGARRFFRGSPPGASFFAATGGDRRPKIAIQGNKLYSFFRADT